MAAKTPLAVELIQSIQAEPDVELSHAPDGRAYITFPGVGGRRETHEIGSPGATHYLTLLVLALEKAPASTLLATISTGLEALAITGSCRPVFTRVANLPDQVVIDLGDEDGYAVRCTRNGWEIVREAPVLFVRPKSALPLPLPMRDAVTPSDLRAVCAEMSDAAFVLVVGWLIIALVGRAPFPLLFLQGGQGSGKSTTASMLRGLVDPNVASLRALPDTERDLAVMADNSSLLVLDNVSEITREMADCLCRFTSGIGFSTRRLYRNRDEELFQIARPAIVTAITDVIGPADDLRDRTLHIRVEPPRNRITDSGLMAYYEHIRPGLLALLLDGVSAALSPDSGDDMAELPRLADAALAANAGLDALDFGPSAFTTALNHVRLSNPAYR